MPPVSAKWSLPFASRTGSYQTRRPGNGPAYCSRVVTSAITRRMRSQSSWQSFATSIRSHSSRGITSSVPPAVPSNVSRTSRRVSDAVTKSSESTQPGPSAVRESTGSSRTAEIAAGRTRRFAAQFLRAIVGRHARQGQQRIAQAVRRLGIGQQRNVRNARFGDPSMPLGQRRRVGRPRCSPSMKAGSTRNRRTNARPGDAARRALTATLVKWSRSEAIAAGSHPAGRRVFVASAAAKLKSRRWASARPRI